jgi:hypothetical protein
MTGLISFLIYNQQTAIQCQHSQTSYSSTTKILISFEEPVLLSKGNLVVVGKNPAGKPFHEGGDAFILNPNHEYAVLCQFVLGGKKIVCHKNA